jgi:hypothetical protein
MLLGESRIDGNGMPSAPPYPESSLHPQRPEITGDPAPNPIDDPGTGESQLEDGPASSKHVFYAVELLVFALVGWGWLAIREYLGDTPVMDVVIVISVFVCTLVNLWLALATPLKQEFAPCAHVYFCHCLALWIIYIYSLAESLRLDTGQLCCVNDSGKQGGGYSAGPTHAAAFFGGLPMHQVPGVVSVAYLTVFLLVAGAQARACSPLPKDWNLRGLGLSLTSMTAVHLGAYLKAPLCNRDQAWSVLSILVGFVAAILIFDFDWAMKIYYLYSLKTKRSTQQRQNHRIIRSAIQTVGVGFSLFFCLILALVLEKTLSIPLLVVFLVSLFASCIGLGYEALTLSGSTALGIKKWVPEPENIIGTGSNVSGLPHRATRGENAFTLAAQGRLADPRGRYDQGPFLRRYPFFLQGQANRGKKSY